MESLSLVQPRLRRWTAMLLLCASSTVSCRTRTDAPDERLALVDLAATAACPELLVLDTRGWLATFDTRTLQFTDQVQLACRPRSGTPTSLNVGRDGTAWVFYSDDELFRVNPTTGACSVAAIDSTAFPQHRYFYSVGSSLCSDGAASETLCVALSYEGPQLIGDMTVGTATWSRLLRLDLATGVTTPVTDFHAPCELADTPEGELWGFSLWGMRRIDKRTGAMEPERALFSNDEPWGSSSAVVATADAFWFFVEIGAINVSDRRQRVARIDRVTGALTTVIEDTGRRVVGVSVNDCGAAVRDRSWSGARREWRCSRGPDRGAAV